MSTINQVKTKVCKYCGQVFTKRPQSTHAKFKAARYCSNSCAHAAKRSKTLPKVCAHCGSEFRRRLTPSGKKAEDLREYEKRKYCDDAACQKVMRSSKNLGKRLVEHKTCEGCNATFERKRYENGALYSLPKWKRRTHCYDCRPIIGQDNVRNEHKRCEYCGDTFYRNTLKSGKLEQKRDFRARKNCLKDSCVKSAALERSKHAIAVKLKKKTQEKTCSMCGDTFYRKRFKDGKPDKPARWSARDKCYNCEPRLGILNPDMYRRTCVHCGDEFGRRIQPSGRREPLWSYSKRKYCDKSACVDEMRRVRASIGGASKVGSKYKKSPKPRKPRPKPNPKPRPKSEPKPNHAPATREAPKGPTKPPTPWGIKHRHTTWETTPATYVTKNGMCDKHPDEPISMYGKCAKCEIMKRGVSQIRRPGLS